MSPDFGVSGAKGLLRAAIEHHCSGHELFDDSTERFGYQQRDVLKLHGR